VIPVGELAKSFSLDDVPAQADLFAATGDREKRPKVTRIAKVVPEMLAALKGQGWVAATILAHWLKLGSDGRRTLRDAAQASEGRIISGQLGYRLTVEASPEEVREATGRLRSQARLMIRRLVKTQRVWHAAGHVPDVN
jgi:hypothetical protein